jgi:hypothetical protein
MPSILKLALSNAWSTGILLSLLVLPVNAQSPMDQSLGTMEAVSETIDSAASAIKTYFQFSSSPPMMSRQLIAQMQDDDLSFKTLMDAAGYKVKEIETGVSVVPYFSLTFGKSRELSEPDRIHVSSLLRKHERANTGPVGYAERKIITAVLDLQDLRDFTLDKVLVDLLPLPKVNFTASPSDAPLSEEATKIIRAIEAINKPIMPINRR